MAPVIAGGLTMGRDNTWGQLLYTLEPGEARGKGRVHLVGPGDLMVRIHSGGSDLPGLEET